MRQWTLQQPFCNMQVSVINLKQLQNIGLFDKRKLLLLHYWICTHWTTCRHCCVWIWRRKYCILQNKMWICLQS